MKKSGLILIGMMLSFSMGALMAQTSKGGFLLGSKTDMSFTNQNLKWKTDNGDRKLESTTELNFNPAFGYFVADGLAVGLELPLTYSNIEAVGNELKSFTIAFTPFLRYYIGSSDVKLYLHGQAGIGKAKTKTKIYIPESGKSYFGMFLYNLGGGVAIFVSEKISIDIGLAYTSTSIKLNKKNDVNLREINSGIAANIGISVVL